jgi:hypothetical protein
MKTVEEKAYKHLSEAMKGSMGSPMNSFYNGFLAGYNEGQSNPKIKQLKWANRFESSDELGIKAQTPFCTYTIIDMKDSGFAEGIYLSSMDDVDVEVSSFDEGKELAQKDFEARVKECLIIE